MKYWVVLLPLLLAACANTVEVEHQAEYKCGEQVIVTEFLDDDSIILRLNGVNNVLTRVASSTGKRYENTATRVTLIQRDGDTYLSISGRDYPLCQKVVR